jgi:hypothetical protein
VVVVSWNQAIKFCEWPSRVTCKAWGQPANAEWDAAVGKSEDPWGADFPPKWDAGNYAISEDGRGDSEKIGVDGIRGTAPV